MPTGGAPGESSGVAVASLNLHYGTDARETPYDVVDACLGLDADVLALQEVWNPDGPDGRRSAIQGLRGQGYEVQWMPLARARVTPTLEIGSDTGTTRGWWGVAIASRLPVLRTWRVPIGRTPLDPAGGRWALCARLETRAGPIGVTALHSTHYVPFALVNALMLSHSLGRPRRWVVVGDLNLWGPAAAVAFRGWQRPVRGRTFPVPRPHSQIDHLFVSGDLEVSSAEVMGSVGSDHLPIRARVSWPRS